MSYEDYQKGYRNASRTWSDEYRQYKNIDSRDQVSVGYCYIVALENDEVKIGFVHSLSRLVPRWKEISLEKLYKVHPVSVQAGGFFREQHLHNAFSASRIPGPGERFRLTEGLKKTIDTYRIHQKAVKAVDEWYGPGFLKFEDVVVMENTPSNFREAKNSSTYGFKKDFFDYRVSGNEIIVSASTEVACVIGALKDGFKNFKWKWDLNSHRRVWDMDF
jgi:hypothetical protein